MPPGTKQRAYDWIEVRESLLRRVESLDPKLVSNRNIRRMYSHLLVALRRATITLVRLVVPQDENGGGVLAVDGGDEPPCIMWNGVNYLSKIWCVDCPGQTVLHYLFSVIEERVRGNSSSFVILREISHSSSLSID